MNSMNSMMSSTMVFTNSHSTPLYSTSWTPSSDGAYAGTCIFLIVLAVILRILFAAKAVLEHRWLAKARNRRYVLVTGRSTEAGKIEVDVDAKTGSLITTQGVEENVKVVRSVGRDVMPFRLSVDLPRAALVTVIGGVTYLLYVLTPSAHMQVLIVFQNVGCNDHEHWVFYVYSCRYIYWGASRWEVQPNRRALMSLGRRDFDFISY